MARFVTIVADDYGIGPETSRGIRELALARRLTATVLIVNSPYAESAVRAWLRDRPDADLGWHPNLTLDSPLCPPDEVPSLVQPDGRFWPLGSFLQRVMRGRVSGAEVEREFRLQYRRFLELVGRPPQLVNSHQHVSLFPPVDGALLRVLADQRPRPYLRRVTEALPALVRVPGARVKRAVLSAWGSRAARRAAALGFPGCEVLAGVTDHACVADPDFWVRWLGAVGPRRTLEVCCHPGHRDETLCPRDGAEDGIKRRTDEQRLLLDPRFAEGLERGAWLPVRPSRLAA